MWGQFGPRVPRSLPGHSEQGLSVFASAAAVPAGLASPGWLAGWDVDLLSRPSGSIWPKRGGLGRGRPIDHRGWLDLSDVRSDDVWAGWVGDGQFSQI